MFKNQRGTFYNNDGLWMILVCILGVIIVPPIAQMAQYGIEEGWARYTAPQPPIDWWHEISNMLLFGGFLIGICIASMILFAIVYWALNYFWLERKETNLKCRIFGHGYIDRSHDQEDDIIMEDGERFHRNIDLWCPICGKEHGKHYLSNTLNKKTGEVRHYR